jgi:hypothetical protein
MHSVQRRPLRIWDLEKTASRWIIRIGKAAAYHRRIWKNQKLVRWERTDSLLGRCIVSECTWRSSICGRRSTDRKRRRGGVRQCRVESTSGLWNCSLQCVKRNETKGFWRRENCNARRDRSGNQSGMESGCGAVFYRGSVPGTLCEILRRGLFNPRRRCAFLAGSIQIELCECTEGKI